MTPSIRTTRDCIEAIEEYTAGGRDAFFASELVQDATLRRLQVMAESTQRLSEQIKAKRPDVDWRGLAGFRNVLTHAYLQIKLERVWNVVEAELPPFKAALLDLLPPER